MMKNLPFQFFCLLACLLLSIQFAHSQCSTGATINITEPDPGELVVAGQVFSITWNGSLQGASCPVGISYRVNGGSWTTIISSTPDDGLHNWSVPGNINSTDVDLGIVYTVPNSSGNAVGDIVHNFTVQPQTITIANPSGGSYNKGCSMNIQWTSYGVGSNVSIELVNASNNSVVAVIADPTSNDGSFSWTVGTNSGGTYPTNIPGGSYKIKMYETGTGGGVAYSAAFTITTPSLTVSVPNGGESYALGSNVPISWTSSNFCGNVSIELVNSSNNYVALIVDNTTNDGSHNWTASGVSAGSYKIKIYKTVASGTSPVVDYSNSTFSLTNPVPIITITNPSGGSYNKGCNMSIQWTSANVGANVSIELVQASNNVVIAVLADPTSNDGNFAWTVGTDLSGAYPTNIPGGSYKIKIYETGTGAGVAYSPAFTITTPTLTVSVPNGGESYALGSTIPIAWSSTNFCGNVSLELVNSSNAFVALIVDNTPNDGTHTWSVSGVSPGNYKVKIYKTVPSGASPVVDYSNNTFAITDPPAGSCSYFTDLTQAADPEAFNAASCLCTLGFVAPQNYGAGNSNGVNPEDSIFRADLAKLAYYAVYKGVLPATNPAKYFPNPFVDLQTTYAGNAYYDYAKALSYLEYGDGVSPFDRDFLNFNPYNRIEKRYALKVVLETFNIPPDNSNGGTIQNVSYGEDAYGYVHKAWDMGLITSPTANAKLNVKRKEVFIIFHRLILTTGNGGCNTSYTSPSPVASHYFNPGNFTPGNLSRSIGAGEGYFSHVPNGSFDIPGFNLDMVFTPSYNSYLLELPKAFRPIEPLGGGWTHPYNSYIIRIPEWSQGDTTVPAKVMVFWASGNVHFYNESTLIPDTYGVFDQITSLGGTTIKIKKKNQVEFTFTKYGSNYSDPYLLTQIEDRNGNDIQILTENGPNGKRRIDKVTDTAGRQLEFNYQTSTITNYLSSVQDVTGGRTMNFTVNSDGNLASFRNPKGNQEYYAYGSNPAWHLIYEVTRPKGNKITNDYYADTRKLKYSRVLQNGTEIYRLDVALTTHYSTANPYVTSVLTDVTSVTSNEFNTTGFLKESVINNSGTNITLQNTYGAANPALPSQVKYGNLSNPNQYFDLDFEYDANGNVLKVTLPDGTYHQFSYNSFNDILSNQNPKGNTSTYLYDSNGNLDKITDPMGFMTDFTVNANGLVTSVVNPANITVSYTYDSFGNRTGVNAPLGINSTFDYDNIGRMTGMTNANNQTTQYEFDLHDLVKKTTRISSGGNVVTQYFYDLNDNLTSVQNALGNSTTMTYDEADFLKTAQFGNDVKQYIYYKDGLLKENQKPDGTVLLHTYDNLGRLISDGYATYQYDTKNNMTQVSKSGNAINFTYDNLNRMTSSSDYYGKTVSYQYDNNGNVTQIIYPGNFIVTYVYDTNDRLTQVTWNGLTATYTYRNDGLVQKLTYPNGSYCDYTYDAAGRMAGISNKKSNGATINSYTFTLDNLGNHLTETKTEPFGNPTYSTLTLANNFNNENEITSSGATSFSFDANGNQTLKGSVSATWDNADLPLTIGSNTYEYDGIGLRRKAVRNGNTVKYIWDVLGMGNVLAEMDDAGNLTAYYVYGMGLLAKVNVSNSQSFFYHYDFRGSTVAVTNSGEAIVNQYNYDAFGELKNVSEAETNPFKFVGRWGVMSESNDLYYMRARYYDAGTGRFLSEDPVWDVNLYGYAGNNPISMFDPKGENELLAELIALPEQIAWEFAENKQKAGSLVAVIATSSKFVAMGAAEILNLMKGGIPGAGVKFVDESIDIIGTAYDIGEAYYLYNVRENIKRKSTKIKVDNGSKQGVGNVAQIPNYSIPQMPVMKKPSPKNKIMRRLMCSRGCIH